MASKVFVDTELTLQAAKITPAGMIGERAFRRTLVTGADDPVSESVCMLPVQ
jgi:hypothetical protein